MTGLTPEMFQTAMDSILECSNLYKMLRRTLTKWKESCDGDSIAKVLIINIIINYYQYCNINILLCI